MSKISIYQGQVPNTATELAAVTRTTAIHTATVANTSASAVDLQIWLAMDGAAAGNANKIYDVITVGADDQVTLPLLANHAMPAGAKLYGQASAATALTLTVSGVE